MKPCKKEFTPSGNDVRAYEYEEGYNHALRDRNDWLKSEECQKKIEKIIEETHKEFKQEIPYGANRFYICLSQAILTELAKE